MTMGEVPSRGKGEDHINDGTALANFKFKKGRKKKNSKGKNYTVIKTKTITAKVINFTLLAMRHGFQPISARRSFFTGGPYAGAEWWHFQWETGLKQGVTTFGEELLKVYTKAEAKKFIYWEEAKDSKWKIDWF